MEHVERTLGSKRAGARVAIAVSITLLVGFLSGMATRSSVATWYPTLHKPWFNPPNAVFGPVWAVLYILMGVAAGWVWNKGAERVDVRKALGVFALQLGFNAAWSLIFFGLREPAWALVEMIVLLGAIGWCIRLFGRIHPQSALLLAPYVGWVCFAAVLNGAIVMLNRSTMS
jgi:translocator protein